MQIAVKRQLSLQSLPAPITAQEFCRRWYGLHESPEKEALEIEIEEGYRKKYIYLLARATGVKPRTVLTWGRGLKFEKMPEDYKQVLACVLLSAQVGAERKDVA